MLSTIVGILFLCWIAYSIVTVWIGSLIEKYEDKQYDIHWRRIVDDRIANTMKNIDRDIPDGQPQVWNKYVEFSNEVRSYLPNINLPVSRYDYKSIAKMRRYVNRKQG